MFRIYFLLPLLIPLAFVKGDFAEGVFHRLERWMESLAAKPARAMAFVGVLSFLVCAVITLSIRIPPPQVHDEFAYLLLGDTFAHGRVTNPTPPLWQHFETIHEIMRPTYTAKYPPGQGVALAVGQLLGRPIIGVWLATALACMAMCWMLLAWMPARWALAGGVLTAFHPLVLEWSQNYWGGAVAMGGGALVLGGFRRLLNGPRARDAMVMGLGIAILANSRPYEGLVFCLLVGLAMAVWLVKVRPVGFFPRVIAPLAVMMALLACEVGYYNWRVTGNPLVMPYIVHEQTYGITPLFLFGAPRPEPVYRHLEIQKLQESYLAYYQSQRRSIGALAGATVEKIWTLAQGYLWSYLMVVALLGLPWALARDRWLWFVLIAGCFFTITVLLGTWVFPHYAAPAAGLFFVLVMQSMRSLYTWRAGNRRVGRNIVRGLAILFVISFFQVWYKMSARNEGLWYFQRQTLLDKLRGEGGESLLIVRYSTQHNPNREWVYNEADIVHARVILARDMGAEKNKELLDYFPDRKAWVVDADADKPELEPYPGS